MAKLPPYERMIKRVVPNEDGCWIFMGCKEKFGYGKVSTNGGFDRTHRVAYRKFYGEIPDGLCVLHSCDVPACCNPSHLFLGTKADNAIDKAKKCRANKKLTEGDVMAIRIATGTNEAVGRRFGVSASLISMIQTGKERKYV